MRKIGLSAAVIFVVATAVPNVQADAITEAKTQAGEVGGDVKAMAGSREKLHTNFIDPLVSPTDMKRFDGSTFSAQIGCPTEKKALELVIAPGGSGDITTAVLSQDLNSDGTLETVQTLPFHISGVCSNGYVSCTDGTWSGCNYYQWDALATGQIQLKSVTTEELGGCYCINNHCGANLVMTNLNNILGDLTGGMMATVSEVKNQYTPSRFLASGTVGTYYARSLADCTTPPATQTNTAYFSDPGSINANAFSATTGTDTAAETYQLVTTSLAAEESKSALQACTDTRNITTTYDLVDIPSCTPNTWFAITRTTRDFDYHGSAAWLEAQAYCVPGGPMQLRFRAWDEHYTDPNEFVTITVPYPSDSITSGYTMTHPNLVGSSTYDVPFFYSGGCVSSTGSCTFSFTAYDGSVFDTSTPDGVRYGYHPELCADLIATYPYEVDTANCIDLPAGGSVVYERQMTFSLIFERPHLTPTPDPATCRLNSEWVDDQCGVLSSQPGCSLFEETIDGVAIIKDYNATGLTPLPSTRTFSDAVCSLSYTRDWWQKDRTYRCLTNATYRDAIDDAVYRAGVVEKSVDAATGEYKDTQKVGGTWTPETRRVPIDVTVDTLPTCTQICKTKRAIENVDAAGAGVSSDLRVDRTSYEYAYRECDLSATCPLEPGESVDTPCGCINEFGEAMATIQAYRMASMDLICTSGVPQQP